MPLCDWLIADDSFQQAGVGLAKERRVGGGEKGEQEVGVKLSPTACTLMCSAVVQRAVSHKSTQHKYLQTESTSSIHLLIVFSAHLFSRGCL